MDAHTEEALVRRFRAGDGEAFGELFAASTPAVTRRLHQKFDGPLQRRLSIADLLQEIRLEAWQGREGFEPRGPGAFRRWLLGIADHALSHARARHRAARRDLQLEVSRRDRAATGEFLGTFTSPSQGAIRGEASRRVRAALATLPALQREVVELVHREQLGLREIAGRIGKSYAATKKIHARALLRIGGILDPGDGEGDGDGADA